MKHFPQPHAFAIGMPSPAPAKEHAALLPCMIVPDPAS